MNIVNNNSTGGAVQDALSVDADGRQTLNVEGAKCIASRVINFGQATAPALTDAVLAELRRSGNLRGKPGIIVHGRADALVPVNHTSRAYFGLNKITDTASKLSYIEVVNAQHHDSLNGRVAGFDTRYVPIQRYFNQAMDAVFANLRSNAVLPASQVVRATPRGGSAGARPYRQSVHAGRLPRARHVDLGRARAPDRAPRAARGFHGARQRRRVLPPFRPGGVRQARDPGLVPLRRRARGLPP
ncbi:MAG: hypothetical protein HC782_02745, partial [Gammaproteobacteria bacterium]|nr:hypothetical protein [Gammaproteobacteria bacterium]